MLKDVLATIKADMKDVRSSKKYVRDDLKHKVSEVEARRKEALAEYDHLPEDDWYRQYAYSTTNERYDRILAEAINWVFSQYHNDQMYYIIYKDGSDVCISAEEILDGEPFPKLTGIVYAEMSSADDHMDTETGDLFWYSDEHMEACGGDYDVEDDRKWQYETAIQFKYGTEWSRRWKEAHPDFMPAAI